MGFAVKYDFVIVYVWTGRESLDKGLRTALAAIRLLKRFAEHSESEAQQALYLEAAQEYESLAKGILDKCFNYSKYDMVRLMLQKCPQWGNVTMTALTIAAGSRLLKTHPAVQMITSCAWRGALSSSTTWAQESGFIVQR